MFKVLIPSWICPVVHPSCVDNWLIAFPLPWIADINSSRVESLFRMFNPSPPPLPRFPKNPPLLFPPHPIKINSNKMAKKSLPKTVMTGTIVTMTSLKCVVVEEDGECDGKGSLLFQ